MTPTERRKRKLFWMVLGVRFGQAMLGGALGALAVIAFLHFS